MINNFIVKANTEKNQLRLVLDGFFMNSEIELAMHLAKRESKKLKKGYNVLVDITRLNSADKKISHNYSRIQQQLNLMGSGDIKFIDMTQESADYKNVFVGFYPYENGWFF
jgi:hypothetical protein